MHKDIINKMYPGWLKGDEDPLPWKNLSNF